MNPCPGFRAPDINAQSRACGSRQGLNSNVPQAGRRETVCSVEVKLLGLVVIFQGDINCEETFQAFSISS